MSDEAPLPPGHPDRLFRCGDDRLDLVGLIDGAYDLVEIWQPQGPFNQKWKEAWLKRARELGAHPSP
jgi:hypothetical protein